MGFNISYFSQMGYGGAGGNSIWHYFDYAADNVASICVSSAVNTAFFSAAYNTYGIIARAGDIILCSSRQASNGGLNTASPCMFVVPSNWDSNGASVMGPRSQS